MPCSCPTLSLLNGAIAPQQLCSPPFPQISARSYWGRGRKGTGLGLWVSFAPVSRPRKVPFPPPQDPHPRDHPRLSNSIKSYLHSCLPMARAPGWVPAAGQPPSSPSCSLKRAASVQQLPTSSFSSEAVLMTAQTLQNALC